VGVEETPSRRDKIEKLTAADVGQIMASQRKRLGLSQGDIGRELGYQNINFISMTESGSSKVPLNRVADFVDAYRMSPEFAILILQVQYPEVLQTILRLSKKAPRIFKNFTKDPTKEIEKIYANSIR
jgi:transcriptional regulator with XRE-family HTH domain